MSTIRVALLQMASCGSDQEANLAKGEEFCRRAAAQGADIALFPEMWNIGYTPFAPPGGPETNLWRAPALWDGQVAPEPEALAVARRRWQAQAVDLSDGYGRHFRALARELGMAIALTYLERWPGAPRNTVSLIDRHGEVVFTYAKVHTCDFSADEAACTPGDGFYTGELDTAAGLVRVGAMICYDREFPESARILMLQGAEIILTPNACELDTHRLGQFRTRALENMVGVAMANYAAPQENGHSVAFHPMAYDAQGRAHDLLLVEAGEVEGIYMAPFEMDAIRAYRERESWGNAFRRPHRYGAITSLEVAPPFVRVNPAGEPYPRTER